MKKLFSVLVVTFCSLQSVPITLITLPPAAELLRRFDKHLPKLSAFVREWGICEQIGGQPIELQELAFIFSYIAFDYVVGSRLSEIVVGGKYDDDVAKLIHEVIGSLGTSVTRRIIEADPCPSTENRLYRLRILLNKTETVLEILGAKGSWPEDDIEFFRQFGSGPRGFMDDLIEEIEQMMNFIKPSFPYPRRPFGIPGDPEYGMDD